MPPLALNYVRRKKIALMWYSLKLTCQIWMAMNFFSMSLKKFMFLYKNVIKLILYINYYNKFWSYFTYHSEIYMQWCLLMMLQVLWWRLLLMELVIIGLNHCIRTNSRLCGCGSMLLGKPWMKRSNHKKMILNLILMFLIQQWGTQKRTVLIPKNLILMFVMLPLERSLV